MFSSLYNEVCDFLDRVGDSVSSVWESDDGKAFRRSVVVVTESAYVAVVDFLESSGINKALEELDTSYTAFAKELPVNLMWFIPGIVAYLSPFTAVSVFLAPTTFFQLLAVIGLIFYLYQLNRDIGAHSKIITIDSTLA